MNNGIKYAIKRNAIRMVAAMACCVLMVVGYQLLHAGYAQHYQISSHRSVGLMFVSFYFFYIACPALLLMAFLPLRGCAVIYAAVMAFLLLMWFPCHPLRVTGMAAFTSLSAGLLATLKWKLKV